MAPPRRWPFPAGSWELVMLVGGVQFERPCPDEETAPNSTLE